MSCNNQCKPCNPIKFDKPSGFDNRKAQERMEKQLALAKQTELSTMSCGKKIVSITRVGDTVVIMHSDCSFSTAPLSVMDVGAFTQEATRELSETIDKLQKEREEQVKQLTELLNEGKEASDSVKTLINKTVLPEVGKITKFEKDVEDLKKSLDNKSTEPETKPDDSKANGTDVAELAKVTAKALEDLEGKVSGLDKGLQSLKETVVLKSDLIEESHSSFDDSDVIIKTLKFKGK